MPRVHKKKPGSRPYKNYSEEQLLNAIRECRTKAVSVKDASRIYHIPIRTLRNKLNHVYMKDPGRQCSVDSELEESIVAHLLTCAEFGMPLQMNDIRFMVKATLDKNNEKTVEFKDNLPGPDWVRGFISRHQELTLRNCQNIKRARAEVNNESIDRYFKNLEKSLEGVKEENILNFDETNLADEPGSKKCLFRRGVKYPERVMNFSKSNISVMFAGTASGELLPPYVVYKAEHLWESWCERGPKGCRFGRSKNGWMNLSNFEEWFLTVVVPWARRMEGKKVIIGDNLSAHFSEHVIEKCRDMNIAFVLLLPNSTDKCQPLDVSFFGPLKRSWRKQLEAYRQQHPSSSSLDKSLFPRMLAQLLKDMEDKVEVNLKSGFRACGICPLNAQKVLQKIPTVSTSDTSQPRVVSPAVLEYLHQFKYSPSDKPSGNTKQKRKKIPVSPGKSVSAHHLTSQHNPKPKDCSSLATCSAASTSTQPTSTDKPTRNQNSSDNSSEHEYPLSDFDLSDEDEEWLPPKKKSVHKN